MRNDYDILTEMIQWHNAIDTFDYSLVVDWAINSMERGVQNESMLMLASFSKPVDSFEIKPYLYHALKDLGLEEKYGEWSVVAQAHYFLNQIINQCIIPPKIRTVS